VYTNHVHVERGKAAVRVLEALGVDVTVPDVRSSGRAPLSQGMVSTAAEHATAVHERLEPYVDAGHDVVVVEPSDLAMFHREYEHLLPAGDAETLADASYEVLEYVYGLLDERPEREDLFEEPSEARVAYHSHCQQRTLELEPYTTHVLSDLGFDVVTSDVECCGMAGSFGYKTEYYDLSMDVGDELREAFEPHADRRVLASGTSCLEQLSSLMTTPTTHPIEAVADALTQPQNRHGERSTR
jgi:Fe-S oxidoreductase